MFFLLTSRLGGPSVFIFYITPGRDFNQPNAAAPKHETAKQHGMRLQARLGNVRKYQMFGDFVCSQMFGAMEARKLFSAEA